jgi:methylated-DNA-protein-cysteine methyltransferase-like protein
VGAVAEKFRPSGGRVTGEEGAGIVTLRNPDSKFAKILRYVYRIPAGKVATYGDIAYAAGFPGEARLVAWAMNHDLERCPWPRVVGADGKILLSGIKGAEQRTTLKCEGVTFIGLKVDMKKHQVKFTEWESLAASAPTEEKQA